MRIIEVNHSIANRFDGYIEVNKNLKNYPELYESILRHELEHTDKAWSVKDFKVDFMSSDKVNSLQLLKFMFKHPRSFRQILPIIYSKKKGLIIDINLLILYSVLIVMFTIAIWLGLR